MTSSCAMLLCADVWRTLRAWLLHASPQAFGFATFVPRPQCPILMFTVKAKGEEGPRCARLCVEWSAVAFSTDLGLRSEVGRRFGEGHSSELSSNGTKTCRDSPGPVVEDRARCDGRMAAISLWRPGRWRARLRSDGTVSTIKYRALSALAMLGV